jgi:hypothetical protein
MADWRQIQARIRKAKNSTDPPAKLSDLFKRTRDAMVAWELGAIEEKAEHKDEAVNWYTIAARRFRRADWKKKAEEALARLGVLPAEEAETRATERAEETGAEETAEAVHAAPPEFEEAHEERLPLALGELPLTEAPSEAPSQPTPTTGTGEGVKRKRRRGRRGGRGRRRKPAAAAPGLPAQAFAEPTELVPPGPEGIERGALEAPPEAPPVRERPARVEPPAPQLPSERTAHGRAGDPALASRMAYLESMLRRLVGGALHRLDEVDEAPAGPGVFLLSDSDQITLYYVEACQTLRIGLSNLVRGGRAGKSRAGGRGFTDRSDLKAKLAEYLEISEAKVSQYLKDHCVVRWLQLDEDAPLLAHFAIGVLRTPLNLD